jgi:ADP-ribose pyrophosphatase YjhB (NUDIX family)
VTHPALYCPACGSPLTTRYVAEEQRERLVCTACERIHYLNPTIVAGVIPVADEQVWLLRRGIEPRIGAWTFPAGFMELGETLEDAAVRETREELNLDVSLDGLLNVYSLPGMTTVHVVYVGRALSTASVGHETLEVGLFHPVDIPWDDLAFRTTHLALGEWIASRQVG